jgi:hypothetical protein
VAIDTAEKRRSAGGVGFWVVGPGVTPNAAKDVEWRQESGWGYAGSGAPPVAGGLGAALGIGQKRTFVSGGEIVLGGGGWG